MKVDKVLEVLKGYQDILCDCEYFGTGRDKHTDFCNYSRLIREIKEVALDES